MFHSLINFPPSWRKLIKERKTINYQVLFPTDVSLKITMEPPQKKQKHEAKVFSMNLYVSSSGGVTTEGTTERKTSDVTSISEELPQLERHNFCKDVWYYDDEGKGEPFAHSPVDATSSEKLAQYPEEERYLHREAAIRIQLKSGKTMWDGNWQTLGGAVWAHLWPNGSRLYATHGPKPTRRSMRRRSERSEAENPEDDDPIIGALLIYNIDPVGGNTPYYPVDRSRPAPHMSEDLNGGRYRYRYMTMREMRVASRQYYWKGRLEGQKEAQQARKEAWAERQQEKKEAKERYHKALADVPVLREKARLVDLKVTMLKAQAELADAKRVEILKEYNQEKKKGVSEEKLAPLKERYRVAKKEWQRLQKEAFDAGIEKIHANSAANWAPQEVNYATWNYESTWNKPLAELEPTASRSSA